MNIFKSKKHDVPKAQEIVECYDCGMAILKSSAQCVKRSDVRYQYSNTSAEDIFFCKQHKKAYDFELIWASGYRNKIQYVSTYYRNVERVEVSKEGKFINFDYK